MQEALCQANREALLELAADGSLIGLTPTGSDTSARNGELFFQIKIWARANGGWKGFDSSSGFRLSDGSVLSPDAYLVALEGWQPLSPEQPRAAPRFRAPLPRSGGGAGQCQR
jgi:Uma2 family endonuclease